MSSIYSWDQSEAVVTTTTTAALGPTDPILIKSGVTSRMAQSTVASLQSQGQLVSTITLATTATIIPPWGTTVVNATTTATASWQLADPPVAGIIKTFIVQSTSSSSAYHIVTQTAASTVIKSSDGGISGNSLAFRNNTAALCAYAQLQAISTAGWQVISRSVSGLTCT